jgi:type IV pilus assembly protein PilB
MEPTRLRLGELLVDARIITPEQLAEVLEIQKEDGRRLGILLVERGLVNETQLTQILSQQLSVPWVSLYHVDFSKRLLSMVPRDVAAKYCLVPIYVRHVRGQGDTLYVAMDDPTNVEALRICAAWSGLPTRAMIASPSDIRNAIEVYYGPGPEDEQAQGEPQAADRQDADADDGVPAAEAQGSTPDAEPQTSEPQERAPDGPPVEAAASAPQPEALDAASVEVPPGLAPAEERFAETMHSEAAVESATAEPAQAAQQATGQAGDREASAPDRSGYDDSVSVELGAEVPLEEVLSRRSRAPEEEPGSPEPQGQTKTGKVLALTLLDGTTLALPLGRKGKKPRRDSLIKALRELPAELPPDEAVQPLRPASTPPGGVQRPSTPPTGHQIVEALRAAARGADPAVLLGEQARWEAMLAAVLSILLRKGVVTDEELADELSKI